MKSNSKSRSATALFAVLCFAVTQLEMSAFGKSADDSVSNEQRAPESSVEQTSPVGQAGTRAELIARAIPQSQVPAVGVRRNMSPTAPPQEAKKRGSLKWILIAAAAGAGVATVIIVKGSPSEESPMITVGRPTVGEPQ